MKKGNIKHILLLALLFLISFSIYKSITYAQPICIVQGGFQGVNYWRLSGNLYLYPSSTTWNVGIGTTTPQAKLEVNGAIRLTPSATPTNPVEGMMYYDRNERTFKCYVWDPTYQSVRPQNCGGGRAQPPQPIQVPFILYDANDNKVLEINVE